MSTKRPHPYRPGDIGPTILQSTNGASEAQAHSPPPASAPHAPAPYYHDELVDIYNADSTNLSFLADQSVQLVITSPPYNLGKDYGAARDDATYFGYLEWVEQWCRELYRVLETGGRLCLNIPLDINLSFDAGGKRTSSKQPVLADFTELLVRTLGFVYNTTILWLEGNISRRTAWGSWLSASDPWVNTAAEAILVLSRDQRKRSGKGKTSDVERDDFMDWTLGLWAFNGQSTSQYGHPAPFPEELPRRLIQLFSFREDTVLDPFLGSGTTCRVAKNLGRRSIGVELNSQFCAIAADRCSEHDRVTLSGGRTDGAALTVL
jgi:site-specific DNA-methyltransferase (adenine-specific)